MRRSKALPSGKRCISVVIHQEKRSAFQMRASARAGIGVEAGRATAPVVLDQRLEQVVHVAGGEVEALGAGRRHDVGGVAGQEQAAEAHRLGDEAAQRRDATSRSRGR